MLQRYPFALIFVCFGVLTFTALAAEITIPPAPKRPPTEGLPEKEKEAVFWKWRADYQAWESSLTPEQAAERKRLADEQTRQRKELLERQQRLPLPTDGYTWQQAAQKLSPDVVSRLSRDKIAYGPTVKQSFDPYLGGPVFITSDSLLNGFHVLFEDTFREREVQQVAELRKNLEIVINQARQNLAKFSQPAADFAPGWRHAQIVVGPALCLLGTPVDFFDPDVREEINHQVEKIKAAQSIELPTWLAPATNKLPALDYRACKPVGFYALDEALADYFRAVRWLQMIPFRMDRDGELAGIAMLGYGVKEAYETGVEYYFASHGAILGSTNELGLPDAAYEFQNFLSSDRTTWNELLENKKRWLLRNSGLHPASVDQPAPPSNANARLIAIEFRVLPAYLLPDTKLFQQLTDAGLKPDGLAVAAMLGSNFAHNHFSYFTQAEFESALTKARVDQPKPNRGRPTSLYEDYLQVLRTLFTSPPNDAPAFMQTPAWQAKSCQTALSGWAQMRHTFTLQAHQSVNYFGATIVPPGFVEPNPEFFARMADLIERSRKLLDGNRDRWDTLASMARRLEALTHKQLRQQPWSPEEEKFLKQYGAKLALVMGYAGNSYLTPNDDAPRWAEVHRDQPEDLSLAVAIGRPRVIYVLYPWNGLEILCRGSVMPYYEYSSKERLTDAEWKTLLDSPKAPRQPEWLRPFVTN